MTKQFDPEQARRFVWALGKKKGDIRLRAFLHRKHPSYSGDKGRKDGPSPALIKQWQAEGRGVYIVINDGGDTNDEITACRAVFCEWDDRPKDWQVTAWQELRLPEPTIQVDTGGKSVHSYWVFKEPISPERWKPLQDRLIEFADADRRIKNLARVMRLPGAYHNNPDGSLGEMSAIIHESDIYYTPEDIEICLPPEEQHEEVVTANKFKSYESQTLADIKEALDFIPSAVPDQGQYTFYRNLLWGLIKACEEVGATRDDAVSLIKAHSPRFKEAEQVARSGGKDINAGTFWYFAYKEGYKRKHQTPQLPATSTPAGAGLPFRPLGFDHGIYYYLPNSGGQVIPLSAAQHTKSHFLQLADLNWWLKGFGDERGRINWDSATNYVMGCCIAQGVYDPCRVRGRGAWADADRVIVHLGNRLVVDGRSHVITNPPSTFNTYYFYENAKAIDGPGEQALDDATAQELCEIAMRFRWESEALSSLLLGWIVLAPVCGALNWRPHIWITGGAGTGKTTILKAFIKPLLGGMYEGATGGTTEAGLRGQLRSDAIPVVFDELEQNEQKDKQVVQNILALARIASSEGGKIYKGTTAGGANTFEIRSMFCVSSINVALVQRADLDRFCVLPLCRDEVSKDDWTKFEQRILDACTEDNGRRLVARTIKQIPTIRANARVLARALSKRFGQRFGDQYGTLLAGAWTLRPQGGGELTIEAASAWIDEMNWDSREPDANDADEMKCLNHILQYLVPIPGGRRMSVMELAQMAAHGIRKLDEGHGEEIAPILGRYGIKACEGALVISNSSTNLQAILRDTPWSGSAYRQALKRLPGATGSSGPIRFAGCGVTRAILVPYDWE
jgi:hypothetical protein